MPLYLKMYQPEEDSYIFSEFLEKHISNLKNKNIYYLDMGTGSGILAETAEKAGISRENIISADIEDNALKFVKKKGFNAVKSNLFSNIKKKFDLITFNAPYLPKNEFDKKKDTSGGKKGDEISIKFLKQAKKHLNKDGKIFLLISSLTPLERINKFKPKIVAKRHIFFEDLLILEFGNSSHKLF